MLTLSRCGIVYGDAAREREMARTARDYDVCNSRRSELASPARSSDHSHQRRRVLNFSWMADLAIAFATVGSFGEDPFDLEGDLLDGQIRVDKLVGEGELSVVYRGQHEGVNAPVAIKCLNLPETLDRKLVEPISESFREGARVHYRLARGHLHIAQTLSLGTTVAPRTGEQIPYLVREWLDGRSLADDFAARARANTRPRTAAQAVEMLESAADAIAHAHAEGVCHHSLSPRNLFLAKSKRREVLKVLDFGMARDVAARPANAGLRLLSSHVAPEQLDRRLGAPGPATDVFAFALVLFEAVTGRPYFVPGAHVSELLRVAASREPLSRRTPGLVVPRELHSVLARALAPTPRERPANLRAFWDDVKRAVQHGSPLLRASPILQASPQTRPSIRPASLPPQAYPSSRPASLPTQAHPSSRPASLPPQAYPSSRPASLPPLTVEAPARPPPPPPLPTAAPVKAHSAPPPEAPIRAVVRTTVPVAAPAEVAPPVTTSVGFESTPALSIDLDVSIDVDLDSELDRDTIPTPSIFEDEAVWAARPMLERSVSVHGNALSAHTRGQRARAPAATSRVSVLAGMALVILVLASAVLGRHAPNSASVATPTHDRRSVHTVVNETSMLVLPETTLRVVVPEEPKPTAFNIAGTNRLLDKTAADLESCTVKGGPRGPGSVRLIIHPSGKIIRLQIGPPYSGTTTGECISTRFVATPIPAFLGSPQAVNYIFHTVPFRRR
jgi:serine/threonine-protein kinase